MSTSNSKQKAYQGLLKQHGINMGIVSIGQSVTRHEDPVLLKGQGQYTGDVNYPNQAHGYVLRSPHARAKIFSINTEAALKAPGVL